MVRLPRLRLLHGDHRAIVHSERQPIRLAIAHHGDLWRRLFYAPGWRDFAWHLCRSPGPQGRAAASHRLDDHRDRDDRVRANLCGDWGRCAAHHRACAAVAGLFSWWRVCQRHCLSHRKRAGAAAWLLWLLANGRAGRGRAYRRDFGDRAHALAHARGARRLGLAHPLPVRSHHRSVGALYPPQSR